MIVRAIILIPGRQNDAPDRLGGCPDASSQTQDYSVPLRRYLSSGSTFRSRNSDTDTRLLVAVEHAST